MNDIDAITNLMGKDPLPVQDARLDDRARRDWLHIVGTPRTSRNTMKRRGPALALGGVLTAVGVTLGVAVAVPGSHSASAQAATPPALPLATAAAGPASATLRAIAASAGREKSALPHRPYQYIRTQVWNLDTAVTHGSVRSRLEAVQQETWLRADGTGRSVRRPGDDLRVLGTPEHPASDSQRVIQDVALGSAGTTALPLLDLSSLPYANPAAFADAVQHDAGNAPIAQGHMCSTPSAPCSLGKLWILLTELASG